MCHVQVSFEMAVVANATGFRCDTLAMHGPDLDAHIDDAYKVNYNTAAHMALAWP